MQSNKLSKEKYNLDTKSQTLTNVKERFQMFKCLSFGAEQKHNKVHTHTKNGIKPNKTQ